MKNKKQPLVSICIPAFDNGKNNGFLFLKHCLESIQKQTYSRFQIHISDQSTNNTIFDLFLAFAEYFESGQILFSSIRKLKYPNPIRNWNKVLEKANGDYVHLLHQDDFYLDENSLNRMVEHIVDSGKNWLFTNCSNQRLENITENEFSSSHIGYNTPIMYNGNMFEYNCKNGINYYGNPSTMFFKRSDIKYDVKLKNLVDLDFYLQHYRKYGDPLIIKDNVDIGVTIHKDQISNTINDKIQEKEIAYMHKKWK